MERLKSLCDQINKGMAAEKSAVAVAVELDVAAEGKDMEEAVQKAWEAFGHIDALINNAGYRGDIRSSLDTVEEEWDKTMTTNSKGPWLVSKYVAIRMREAKLKGSIINVASIAGINRGAFHGGVAYSTSKSAVVSLTTVMAIELGQYGIRVNAVAAGLFRSEITEKLMEGRSEMVNSFQLKTLGTIDPALTSLVAYLLDDAAHYVTGNVFIVDAGTSLPGIPIFSSL